jgi:methylmalonyl-CoA mutase N-terminal domain/subunit
MGGMLKAIELGYPQREIARAAYEYQVKVEKGEIPIIGVNVLVEPGVPKVRILRVDPEVRRRVVERLSKFRSERDNVKVTRALDDVMRAAEKPEVNIFPYILEAIRSKATLGEVSKVLREVWGEWKAPEAI